MATKYPQAPAIVEYGLTVKFRRSFGPNNTYALQELIAQFTRELEEACVNGLDANQFEVTRIDFNLDDHDIHYWYEVHGLPDGAYDLEFFNHNSENDE